MVRMLVARGANIKAVPELWEFSLARIAAGKGDIAMLDELTRLGIDPNETDGSGRSALYEAIYQAQIARKNHQDDSDFQNAARLLIARGARIGLREAILLGDLTKVRQLLKSGVDPNQGYMYGSSVLAEAIRERRQEVIRFLLENGAGKTDGAIDVSAAIAAIAAGDRPTLEVILGPPGAVKIPVSGHRRILLAALNRDDSQMAVTYLRRVRLANPFGSIALGMAVSLQRDDVVAHLLNAGVPANARDDAGIPIVVRAGELGQLSLVRDLIQRGADVNAKSTLTGMTPLHCALLRHDEKMAAWLLDQGADPNAADNLGVTPLMRAASLGYGGLVRALIVRGATPEARDRSGQSARDRALQRNHHAVASLLE